VIVEVKRSSDTRIRREVVGQVLDYAANGVKYWSAAGLRKDFENDALAVKKDPDAFITALSPDTTADEFWRQVEQNLRGGHVRMVFVADRLPDELVRVIEFLNEQMSPAEVLGVELQHYIKGESQVLVPRVIGATSAARAAKQRATGVPWTPSTFLATAGERCPAEVKTFERLFEHAGQNGKLSWGKGVSPGVSGWYLVAGTLRGVWTASTGSTNNAAYMYIWLPEIKELLDEDQMQSFLSRLRQIHAIDLELTAGKRKYPNVNLNNGHDGDLEVFLDAVDSLNCN
jgi:hypothetical protein